MSRVVCISFLLLLGMLSANPRLMLAPYTWLPEGAPVEIWAVVEDERDSCEGWTYKWDFAMPEAVLREAVKGYVSNEIDYFLVDEDAFSLTGTVNDSWAIFTRQIFRNRSEASPVRIQATLTLTAPDGRTLAASRVYELGKDREDNAAATMEKRRRFAMLSGLHWLQRRQRPKGGWQGEAYSPASHYGDLFDYKNIDRTLDIELIYTEYGYDYKEVYRESEYYDNYMSMVASACALWAFGNCGYGLDRQEDNPFLGTVRSGLSYLGSRCSTLLLAGLQELGLDENRNGRGAALGEDDQYRGYVQPMAIASIMAVCPPNAKIVLPEGTSTAKELVQDAFDYLGWSLFYYGKSSWPYNYRENSGFDLSIAGWNFLALEALPNWGITVPDSIKTEILRLLYRNEDIAGGGFGYSAPDGNKTIALTSAAVMGLSLASNVDLSKDARHLCPEEERSAGELYLNAMRHLPAIMKKQAEYLDAGYFQWTLIRMLQSEKINAIVSGKNIIDWRNADASRGGLWDRILSLQLFDGRWMFPYEIFTFGYYNDELETSYMLLSLSNELVRRTSVISDLNVVARVPREVGEGILETDFTDMAFNGEEAELSYYRPLWDQASPITLTLDYLLPDGMPGEVLVQQNVEATYINVLGEQECVEDGALHVSRTGEMYGLELTVPPEAPLGDIVPIVVNVRLPKGEGFRLVTLSPGSNESILEYDEPVRWTGLRLFPEGAMLPELGYKPALSSERWIAPSVSLEDGAVSLHNAQGRALKLSCSGNDGVKAFVYHVSSEFSVVLELAGKKQFSQRLDGDFFGGEYEMQPHWNTSGLEAKTYEVRALLLKNGEVLLEDAGSIRLLGQVEYELLGIVAAGSDVYLLEEEAHITSSVMRMKGGDTEDSAEVLIAVASEDASETLAEWSIPNLGEASFWRRKISMFPNSAGSYVVSQSVSSQDGRVWNASTSFSVKGPEQEPVSEDENPPEDENPDEEDNNPDDGQSDEEEAAPVEENEESSDATEEDNNPDDGQSGEEEAVPVDESEESSDATEEDNTEETGEEEKDAEGVVKVRGRRRRSGGVSYSSEMPQATEGDGTETTQNRTIVNYLDGVAHTHADSPDSEVVEDAPDEFASGGGAVVFEKHKGKIYEIASVPEQKTALDARRETSPETAESAAPEVRNVPSLSPGYEIHSLGKLRLAGLWNIYGKGCRVFAGKASVAEPYKSIAINPSEHNMLERHRRLLSSMQKNAFYCDGDLIVEKGFMLKSGIYYVTGDVRIYGGAMGPISLVCRGKAILRGCGEYAPFAENVLVLARKGVFILGEEAKYEGELCSLESEVRILGSWLTFANGGIYGRRAGVYGSNNAFLGNL